MELGVHELHGEAVELFQKLTHWLKDFLLRKKQ
jgi:hypothetical protein